jgi:cardiolipin synthase (CMP-forming)
VFLLLFVTGAESAAVILYAAGAATDFLDGFIARRWRQVSELGRILDPLADRVFIAALAVALVVRGTVPGWLALSIVGRDLVLLSLWPLFERRHVGRIAVNFTGKVATACLLFGLTVLAFGETEWSWAQGREGAGVTFVAAGAILYWIAGAHYAREAAGRLAGARSARGHGG